MPRVLAILAEGFEEIEAVTPVDLLRRAGAAVTLAALTEDPSRNEAVECRGVPRARPRVPSETRDGRAQGAPLHEPIGVESWETSPTALTRQCVTGRCGLVLQADTTLARVANETFDCIFLPGGPGVRHLRADPRVLDLLRAQNAARRWIAAICAAPTVLFEAGVLNGRRHTAHCSVAAELPDLLAHERVVVDGHIITSRGAGTALDFGLAVVERLFSPEKAAEISRSICA